MACRLFRVAATILAVFTLSICASAQTHGGDSSAELPKGLVSFRIALPEGDIYQGDTILVRYILDASRYSIDGFDGSMDGAKLVKVSLEELDTDNPTVFRVVVNARFLVRSKGTLTIHPMSAMIGDTKVYSASTSIEALPGRSYGQEWEIARQFLIAHGAEDGAATLEYKYGNHAIKAFSDAVNRNFVIVTSEEYQPYIKDPILAYGIGTAMWNGEDKQKDNSVYHIISQYVKSLEGFKERGEVYRSKPLEGYKPAKRELEPLLGDIMYAQNSPWNTFFPKEKYAGKDSACLAGCGPVAMAQVLALHRNPVQPYGSAVLTTRTGKGYRVDMRRHPVSFSGDDQDMAHLMIACAGSVGASASPNGTGSYLNDFKGAFIDNWGYSPQCSYVADIPDYDALTILFKDLDAGYPVIVADDAHIFVVDGYARDFVHLNLGWNGYCNGYYRVIVVPTLDGNQLFFREMLSGIRPADKKESLAMNVSVKKPGTLASKINAKKRPLVTKLTIKGPLDGSDIALLRNMAGAPTQGYDGPHGNLMDLDLSGATIVGGKAYGTSSASGVVIHGEAVKGGQRLKYRYDLTNVSDEDWRTITEWGIDRNPNFGLTRNPDGSIYMVLTAEDNTIGDFMFEDCSNLRSIVLPRSAKTIEPSAFHECRALESIKGLPVGFPDSYLATSPRLKYSQYK